ncbi:MAG: TVP38/TMEM64 family protein [Methylocystaceae bacterium]
MNKKQINLTIYASVAVILLGLMVYLAVTMGPEIKRMVSDSGQFKLYLKSFGPFAAMVFMLLQVAQVVVPAVPGEVLQFAGGYVFGTWQGTLYNVGGIFLGSVIAFSLARVVGLPLVHYLVPEKQLKKFNFILKSKKSGLLVLILFFIPGLPKDLLTYMSGLTPVRPLTFIVLTTIARLPANFLATYVGANAIGGNVSMVVVIVVATIITFGTAFMYRGRIMNWVRTLD